MGGIRVKRIYIVFGVVTLFIALAAYAQTVNPWDAAYEADPADTDLVSQGDDEIRDLKAGIRERAEVSHVWDEGAVGTDMGYHLEETAFAIADDPDCSARLLLLGQEPGQLCHETGDDSLWIADDGGVWTQVHGDNMLANPIHVPQNAIILWDQATGDEGCVGGAVAGDCPCGYTEAAEFQNLTIRGADSAPLPEAGIPDDPGENCIGDGSGNSPPCVNQAGLYDDTITIAQMPGHTHEYTAANLDPGGTASMVSPGGAGVASTSTGGDGDHYHPFRTVLFCRKS